MKKQERYLSTREAAAYCQVNFKTVIKWIEEGKLKAYKLPDSGVNRIRIADLIIFLKEFNLPIPAELASTSENRMLIVDDDQGIRKMLHHMFPPINYKVEEAHDGFEAGRKLESFRPDIILLDLQMPGMGGREVLRQIKGNQETANMKVVVVTGECGDEEKKWLLNEGAEAVLHKPVSRVEVVSVVQNLIQATKGGV